MTGLLFLPLLFIILRATITDFRLAVNGDHTTGTITEVLPRSHDGCRFEFAVGARTVSQTAEICGTGHRVGDALAVTYLPGEPAVARPSDQVGTVRTELAFLVLGPTVVIGLGATSLLGNRSRWRGMIQGMSNKDSI